MVFIVFYSNTQADMGQGFGSTDGLVYEAFLAETQPLPYPPSPVPVPVSSSSLCSILIRWDCNRKRRNGEKKNKG